jgi:hypothetical protein
VNSHKIFTQVPFMAIIICRSICKNYKKNEQTCVLFSTDWVSASLHLHLFPFLCNHVWNCYARSTIGEFCMCQYTEIFRIRINISHLVCSVNGINEAMECVNWPKIAEKLNPGIRFINSQYTDVWTVTIRSRNFQK